MMIFCTTCRRNIGMDGHAGDCCQRHEIPAPDPTPQVIAALVLFGVCIAGPLLMLILIWWAL